jgi:hypothetical protein
MACWTSMKLKPSIPIIELLIIPLLFFFSVEFFLLGLDKQEVVIILAALVFFIAALGTIYWINRNFRTIEIGKTINAKGYFRGQLELNLIEIKTYKLREIRMTKYSIQNFNLVLYDQNQNKKLEITQGAYNIEDWDNFINKLTELNIQFLGQEPLVTQWRDQWIALKSRFVR